MNNKNGINELYTIYHKQNFEYYCFMTNDKLQVIKARHAVRNYIDRPIEKEKIDELTALMDECNRRGGLHIQLITNDPKAFDSRLARYGKFSGVNNYFAMVGKKSNGLDETIGYYGEHLVLKAQALGLNTCWVGLTFKKNPDVISVADGEKLRCVIALGYGATQGVAHKVKPIEQVATIDRRLNTSDAANEDGMPAWFRNGVEAALLAPTAVNQQKFKFVLKGDKYVHAKAGLAFFSKVDLGIVKYHFELGAGKENFEWI